jgi:hypothetical protein
VASKKLYKKEVKESYRERLYPKGILFHFVQLLLINRPRSVLQTIPVAERDTPLQ